MGEIRIGERVLDNILYFKQHRAWATDTDNKACKSNYQNISISSDIAFLYHTVRVPYRNQCQGLKKYLIYKKAILIICLILGTLING